MAKDCIKTVQGILGLDIESGAAIRAAGLVIDAFLDDCQEKSELGGMLAGHDEYSQEIMGLKLDADLEKINDERICWCNGNELIIFNYSQHSGFEVLLASCTDRLETRQMATLEQVVKALGVNRIVQADKSEPIRYKLMGNDNKQTRESADE